MFGVPKLYFKGATAMTKNYSDTFCRRLLGTEKDYPLPKVQCPAGARPLSKSCGCGKVKVCKISGDRKSCARMASLGVLPGSELELLCPSRGRGRRQCMVKVNGGTLSLDELTAENIFVKHT
jgi:Fe2+ transport system protein FeoA